VAADESPHWVRECLPGMHPGKPLSQGLGLLGFPAPQQHGRLKDVEAPHEAWPIWDKQ
jgi:hypothetical protein